MDEDEGYSSHVDVWLVLGLGLGLGLFKPCRRVVSVRVRVRVGVRVIQAM